MSRSPGRLLEIVGTDLAEAAAEAAVRKVAEIAQRSIASAAPPGRTAAAVTLKVANQGFETEATVRAGGLAPLLVFGTVPHLILPRKRKALAWRGANHPAGDVNHPGSAPNDFVARGIREALGEVEEALKEVGDDLVAELSDELEGTQ